ncbi:MAG TPA: hypothetical protein PKM69_09410, partial [Bacteroidales bacterium]|nr:hypothetical protein [Bacteroidales bacterium]
IWNEVVKITKACNHRINTDSAEKITIFAERMLKQVSAIESIIPLVDLSHERDYFHSLLKR